MSTVKILERKKVLNEKSDMPPRIDNQYISRKKINFDYQDKFIYECYSPHYSSNMQHIYSRVLDKILYSINNELSLDLPYDKGPKLRLDQLPTLVEKAKEVAYTVAILFDD